MPLSLFLIGNVHYIHGIPDHYNVRFGERHTTSAYSMCVRYTLVLHCNVPVCFVIELHILHMRSFTHWHIIIVKKA